MGYSTEKGGELYEMVLSGKDPITVKLLQIVNEAKSANSCSKRNTENVIQNSNGNNDHEPCYPLQNLKTLAKHCRRYACRGETLKYEGIFVGIDSPIESQNTNIPCITEATCKKEQTIAIASPQ